MTKNEVESLNRSELRKAAKLAGLKYSKMSLLQIREALVAAKPVKTKEKKDKPIARANSKMALAIALVQKNPNLPRKTIIQKFQDEVKLTKAGANTYHSLVMKKLAK